MQTLFWKHNIHSLIAGKFHSIKHESSQPHLMKDRAWLSWECSAQYQYSRGIHLGNRMAPLWFAFVRTSQKRPKHLYWNGWSWDIKLQSSEVLLTVYMFLHPDSFPGLSQKLQKVNRSCIQRWRLTAPLYISCTFRSREVRGEFYSWLTWVLCLMLYFCHESIMSEIRFYTQ
jgi:hypothetical protein